MATSRLHARPPVVEPGTFNSSKWREGTYVRNYDHRHLRPVEVLLMLRFREQFAGRVLELGCGTGRLTGYLGEVAQEAYGIDLSSAMIARARARYPRVSFLEGDMRDLSHFEDGSLDVVFGGCNILDILGDHERREMLREIRRVLTGGGLMIVSAHNRAHLPQLPGPLHMDTSRPQRALRDAIKVPERVFNHLRLRGLERVEPGYELVNNAAHDFSLVHYFITRDEQCRQLSDEGFEPLLCLDLEGRIVEPGALAADCLELHYVAEKR